MNANEKVMDDTAADQISQIHKLIARYHVKMAKIPFTPDSSNADYCREQLHCAERVLDAIENVISS